MLCQPTLVTLIVFFYMIQLGRTRKTVRHCACAACGVVFECLYASAPNVL